MFILAFVLSIPVLVLLPVLPFMLLSLLHLWFLPLGLPPLHGVPRVSLAPPHGPLCPVLLLLLPLLPLMPAAFLVLWQPVSPSESVTPLLLRAVFSALSGSPLGAWHAFLCPAPVCLGDVVSPGSVGWDPCLCCCGR